MSLIPALQVGLFPWTAICCIAIPVHADLYTRLFFIFSVKVFQQIAFKQGLVELTSEKQLLYSPFPLLTITNCSLSAGKVISCLTTCSTQRTEFICCCRAEKPQIMVTFWLYKSKMQKLCIKFWLITRFRQELQNLAQGHELLNPPSQQCKDTNYLLVHLSPWSLHTPLGIMLDVLMFDSSTGKTVPSYYTHSDFEIFCTNPHLERYF